MADHLPGRVLPVSTQPPIGFDLLVDREFSQIRELLQPGKRQRDEARGRIRTLLAMEFHVAEGVDISEADIDRVEKSDLGAENCGAMCFPPRRSRHSNIGNRRDYQRPLHEENRGRCAGASPHYVRRQRHVPRR